MKSVFSGLFLFFLSLALFAEEKTLVQEDPNISSLDWGKIEGRIRLYHIFEPAYAKSGRENDYKINGSTIGGYIRYLSPEFSGFGATTALYYARGTGLNDKNDVDTIMAAGRFFTKDYSPKAVLGELNVHYKDDRHYGVIGRYHIDSPLTNSIYTYMPNMFQAALYENSSLSDTKIIVSQIEKMAYGTRSPVEFGLIGELTRTAGATQNGIDTRGDFLDIEKQTLADNNANTNGLTAFAVENSSFDNTKLRLWDFYAHDIINMFYVDTTYTNKKVSLPYSLSAQYLRIDSIGDDLADKWMDSDSAYLWGLKATLKYNKAFFHISYNHSGSSRILNPWSGDPAYTSTFFSRNAYRADVDAYKIGFNYDILQNLKLITYYADYGMSNTPGTFAPSKPIELPVKLGEDDAIETAVLLKYKPIEDLTILGGVIYKTSEYFYAGKQVELLDVDLVISYTF
ncbi:MAG: hypothetical protein COA44_08425 [Arcobacter sp.]|nr:MAG: hypothetical protein COA44_08425 [Arcobacter sp.]